MKTLREIANMIAEKERNTYTYQLQTHFHTYNRYSRFIIYNYLGIPIASMGENWGRKFCDGDRDKLEKIEKKLRFRPGAFTKDRERKPLPHDLLHMVLEMIDKPSN